MLIPVAANASGNRQPETSSPAVISDSVAADPSGEWRLSTSLPAWISGVTNIAGEYVFSRHWSAGLYMSYSGWNYFRQTQKFRVAEFRPEVRYWFGGNARGFFVEGHLAVISYNVALPSWNFRYQDRGGSHPALGGGIGADSAAISPATASGRGKPLSDSADIISTTTASRTPDRKAALSTRRSADFSASTTSQCQSSIHSAPTSDEKAKICVNDSCRLAEPAVAVGVCP